MGLRRKLYPSGTKTRESNPIFPLRAKRPRRVCGAVSECRCRPINGCQAHHPETRIADYVADGGRIDLYRLSPIGPARILGSSEGNGKAWASGEGLVQLDLLESIPVLGVVTGDGEPRWGLTWTSFCSRSRLISSTYIILCRA